MTSPYCFNLGPGSVQISPSNHQAAPTATRPKPGPSEEEIAKKRIDGLVAEAERSHNPKAQRALMEFRRVEATEPQINANGWRVFGAPGAPGWHEFHDARRLAIRGLLSACFDESELQFGASKAQRSQSSNSLRDLQRDVLSQFNRKS